MKKIIYHLSLVIGLAWMLPQQSHGQSFPLEDMSAFRPQAGNWRIVSDVTMDPTVSTHEEHAAPPAAAETQGKKKKSKEPAPPAPRQAVTFREGKGVLLNINDATKKDNLLTAFEHGDIELEFDVMLPKGSNSGIYLQGRYEVQLFDSWGVRNPSFSDIGGIYRNWENQPGKIYMGKAPLSNPSKAPGLWQHMKISFRAPKFDANGKKIANARFARVELNGVVIHQNLEVPLPTGGPVENNEKPTGPLMIQGDHGPVAFRNINYRLMKDIDVKLNDIAYKTFYGNFKTVSDFASLTPAASGKLTELTCEVLDKENGYGSIYTGTITVPEGADYIFNLRYTGGARLVINGRELVNLQRADAWDDSPALIHLEPGAYPFEIDNFKDADWMPPRLGLSVKTFNTYPKNLEAFNSYPPDDDPTSPILINATNTPRLLRAFVDFKADRSRRLTHTIGVGDPNGVNYVYDLHSGNLVCVWRGDFVNATPMWHDRGDGSFRPMGAPQYLFTNQPLAFLAGPTDAFPVASSDADFKGKGYRIDDATGRPIFRYQYKDLDVEDKVTPEEDRFITHDITIKSQNPSPANLYYKMAEGKNIVTMPDGSYAIDDKQYYIRVDPSLKPGIREANGLQELIVPVQGSSIKYSVIW